MSVHPDTLALNGHAGAVDCALDWPAQAPRGWALLLHPHPLYGGARGNKVVTTLARACTLAGLLAVRPDFRGVGRSGGTYDEGRGEADDMLGLPAQLLERFPELQGLPFVLGGFSFGSAVASQVEARADQAGLPPRVGVMLVGAAVERFEVARVPPDTLVVHGEQDDTIALASVLDWARPQDQPVVVIPDASHFFHGKLVPLRRVVENYLRLVLPAHAG
ncbi:alpha/beta hydrolase [Verticiella sediminum]|uniref:Alpha/beta hydrolase n=1 Tax=Verticiella sediminum TaxID=1247510 RepID=A0A556AQ73_9BURK|nr:alpha/beta hydrolase [Verticiella sediminum]TSH95064.1 alpha/beta hydrolase [Verticiella sediminum]